jgi:hypothetical protein
MHKSENLKRWVHWGYIGADWRIILKWILKEKVTRRGQESSGTEQAAVAGYYEHGSAGSFLYSKSGRSVKLSTRPHREVFYRMNSLYRVLFLFFLLSEMATNLLQLRLRVCRISQEMKLRTKNWSFLVTIVYTPSDSSSLCPWKPLTQFPNTGSCCVIVGSGYPGFPLSVYTLQSIGMPLNIIEREQAVTFGVPVGKSACFLLK